MNQDQPPRTPTPRQVTSYHVCLKCKEPCDTYLSRSRLTALGDTRLSRCCKAAVRLERGRR